MRWATAYEPCKKVAPKKTAETDAIFEQMAKVREQAQADPTVLRISLDAKANVLLGDFSRGGKKRIVVKAADHDFQASDQVTPYAIFLPDQDRIFLYFTRSRVTSDFMADCLLDCWQHIRQEFPQVQTLLLLQDNGPENHSRRTQFMFRMVQLADLLQLTIQLAYYPPYHSKYNPVERLWGVLEQHWQGDLLDSLETDLAFAKTMTWNQQSPVVSMIHQLYQTGVRLTQKAMALLEQRFQRLMGLEKYFVLIRPLPLSISG